VTLVTPIGCAELLDRISAYLDGDLDATSCQALEAHAAVCDRCTTLIGDFRRATGLCRSAADAPLPEAVRKLAKDRVKALLAREPFG